MKVGTCIIYALKVQGPKSKIYEASSNLCGQILPAKSINEHMISNVLRKTMDFGEMAERSKAAVLKTVRGVRPSRVRIPVSPP